MVERQVEALRVVGSSPALGTNMPVKFIRYGHPTHIREVVGSSPTAGTKRRDIMNPYEINELENQDLYCEFCDCLISTQEYLDNQGICNKCLEKE